MEIQLAVAAVAGFVAALLVVVFMERQSYGDVVPLLVLSRITGSDILDVSNAQVYAFTLVAGPILGVGGKLVGIGAFGDFPIPVAGIDLLTYQELSGGVFVVCVVSVLGAFVFLPRFEAEVSAPERVRRQWLLTCLVYGIGFVVGVPLAGYVVPGA